MRCRKNPRRSLPVILAIAGTLAVSGFAFAAIVWTTLEDFHLSGTQAGDVGTDTILHSDVCLNCHADYDIRTEPYGNWAGSLMGQAGRDPLFHAQLTNANQDVAEVGNFCLRCHVPMSFVTGHAVPSDGSALDWADRDGVTCHICHSLVDPIYVPGVSPPEDERILAAMPEVPGFYGNAMFVLDPSGTRRGPYRQSPALHEWIYSPFHESGDLCGTCHDVGNVAVSLRPDGTWGYNQIGRRVPDEDPHAQFPLERTYSEWKQSAYARGGVDTHGRFGTGPSGMTETCQDCHMPHRPGRASPFAPWRREVPVHEFSGGAASVLELIKEYGSPEVNPRLIELGIQRDVEMLQRAASIEIVQERGSLRVRLVNETGHKLPTGHIEGRRVWIDVQFYGASGELLREYGHYDGERALLDEPSTRIYEMEVGLSPEAAAFTGLPPGRTGHMALADTIVKDNRIPPRGFSNVAFNRAGAPVVAAVYQDRQHWDDTWFTIPPGSVRTVATANYQCLPRRYIEELRDGNVTDRRGQTLYDLWERHGQGAPIAMVSVECDLTRFLPGDLDGNCVVDARDVLALVDSMGRDWADPGFVPGADLDGDHDVDRRDLRMLFVLLGTRCP